MKKQWKIIMKYLPKQKQTAVIAGEKLINSPRALFEQAISINGQAFLSKPMRKGYVRISKRTSTVMKKAEFKTVKDFLLFVGRYAVKGLEQFEHAGKITLHELSVFYGQHRYLLDQTP